jgi:hypothetical protein
MTDLDVDFGGVGIVRTEGIGHDLDASGELQEDRQRVALPLVRGRRDGEVRLLARTLLGSTTRMRLQLSLMVASKHHSFAYYNCL